MLLALWSAYGFDSGAPPTPPSRTQGGSLGWYYNGWPEDKKEKAEKIESQFFSVLEKVSPDDFDSYLSRYESQKIAIARNIAAKIGVIDVFNSDDFQAVIKAASDRYYQKLANERELEDELAVILLIN